MQCMQCRLYWTSAICVIIALFLVLLCTLANIHSHVFIFIMTHILYMFVLLIVHVHSLFLIFTRHFRFDIHPDDHHHRQHRRPIPRFLGHHGHHPVRTPRGNFDGQRADRVHEEGRGTCTGNNSINVSPTVVVQQGFMYPSSPSCVV